jgi:phosphoribosylpyrophosphate synthetase
MTLAIRMTVLMFLVKVITVDIHSPQSEAFFSIPVDCLTARFIFER